MIHLPAIRVVDVYGQKFLARLYAFDPIYHEERDDFNFLKDVGC